MLEPIYGLLVGVLELGFSHNLASSTSNVGKQRPFCMTERNAKEGASIRQIVALSTREWTIDVRVQLRTKTKTYWEVEVYLNEFVTSRLDRDEWSASHPGHLIYAERTPGIHWIGS